MRTRALYAVDQACSSLHEWTSHIIPSSAAGGRTVTSEDFAAASCAPLSARAVGCCARDRQGRTMPHVWRRRGECKLQIERL